MSREFYHETNTNVSVVPGSRDTFYLTHPPKDQRVYSSGSFVPS